ncbi:uncharacterized protein LOC110714214 [Chenopodium quinoa]|uniref:uncharacterized protein LOC110714214 n=1 Tax=Chenopodium quinoa TaxID=63459 RepID=UPI000B77333F|nr:uncharacterized protein LOC110714214 [Chenopodium quinoa]
MGEAEGFRMAVETCELADLGYVGHGFSWTNNQGGDRNVPERLDLFLENKVWKGLFSGSFVTHLSKRKSDHLPILLCFNEGVGKTKKKKKFKKYRFEEMWLRDETCGDIVKEAWNWGGDICLKFAHTSINLSTWSRNKFGDFIKEMKDCKGRMESLMGETQTEEIIAQIRDLDDKMDELEKREEAYWRQRSRQEWLKMVIKTRLFSTRRLARENQETILEK